MSNGTMLFLHGMQSRYGSVPPAQIEHSAREYAELKGYALEVIPISGDKRNAQYNSASKRIAKGGVTGLYGFSAGGYNVARLLATMAKHFLSQITLAVIVGAPGAKAPSSVKCVIFDDPPAGHLHGPQALLEKTIGETKNA